MSGEPSRMPSAEIPEINCGSSVSLRGVSHGCEGDSMVQPIFGVWDSPKIETFTVVPKVEVIIYDSIL